MKDVRVSRPPPSAPALSGVRSAYVLRVRRYMYPAADENERARKKGGTTT